MIDAATLRIGTGAKSRIYSAAVRLFAERGADAVTVSDLADAAGTARGTIYNNIFEPENLFEEVASALSHEMIERIEATIGALEDPVARLSAGIRIFVRRSHTDPDWGRFLVRFGMSHAALQALMADPPGRDLRKAIQQNRFKADLADVPAMITMLNGSTLAAMNAVIWGDQTWREAGSSTAELFLRAGGVARPEARKISRTELPPLAEAPPKKKSPASGTRKAAREHH